MDGVKKHSFVTLSEKASPPLVILRSVRPSVIPTEQSERRDLVQNVKVG